MYLALPSVGRKVVRRALNTERGLLNAGAAQWREGFDVSPPFYVGALKLAEKPDVLAACREILAERDESAKLP